MFYAQVCNTHNNHNALNTWARGSSSAEVTSQCFDVGLNRAGESNQPPENRGYAAFDRPVTPQNNLGQNYLHVPLIYTTVSFVSRGHSWPLLFLSSGARWRLLAWATLAQASLLTLSRPGGEIQVNLLQKRDNT